MIVRVRSASLALSAALAGLVPAAAQEAVFQVQPGSTAHAAFFPENARAYLVGQADGDGDGGVAIPLPPDTFGVYYDIRNDNGARLHGCDGTFVMPMTAGEVVAHPAFESLDGVTLLTAADGRALRDSGVSFADGQEVLVTNGMIAETPLVVIKDSSALTDPTQLLDQAFVHALPMYEGPAVYRAALRLQAGDVPLVYCSGKTNSVGCVPSVGTAGQPSASSTAPFLIAAEDVVASEAGVLLYSFKKASLDFHGGKLCVKAPFVRTSAKVAKNSPSATCGAPNTGRLVRNFNATIQGGSDPMLSVGATVFAQWRQRDPADPAGFGDGLTNAVRFLIAP